MFFTKTTVAVVAVTAALGSAGVASACAPAYFAAHPAQAAKLISVAQSRKLQVIRQGSVQLRTYFGVVRLAG